MKTAKIAAMNAVILATALGSFGHEIEAVISNTNGKDLENLPVFVQVRSIVGRGRDYQQVNRDGFHVYDEKGKEVSFMYRPMPPDFSMATDEIVFILPKLAKDAALRYRFSNTSTKSAKQVPFNVDEILNNPNNWIPNPGFEKGAEHWTGGTIVNDVTHSGKNALLLQSRKGQVSATLDKSFQFNKDGHYYWAAWLKTDNVVRYSYRSQKSGGRILLANYPFRGYEYAVQDTRDWYCYRPNDPRRASKETYATHWQPRTVTHPMVGQYRDYKMAKKKRETAAWRNGYKSSLSLTLNQTPAVYIDSARPGRIWLDDIMLFDQPKIVMDYDGALKKADLDGKDFVYSRAVTHHLKRVAPWEKIDRYASFAARGERKVVPIGVNLPNGAKNLDLAISDLTGPGTLGQSIRETEYQITSWERPPEGRDERQAHLMTGPIDNSKPCNVDFLIAYRIPSDAKPGRYKGTIAVKAGGKTVADVPVTLEVLNFPLKIIKDRFIGAIAQGRGFDKKWFEVYSRSNFPYVMMFSHWVPFRKKGSAGGFIDMPRLIEKQKMALEVGGVTAGVGLYWSAALDKFGRNGLWPKTGRNPEKYRAEAVKVHKALTEAGLPVLVYMLFDEPRRIDRKAFSVLKGTGVPTTCDAMGRAFFDMLNLITHNSYDDPCDEWGPALYRYCNAKGYKHGFCGSAWRINCSRYQVGMMLAAGKAHYWHQWHSHCFYRISPETKKWSRARVAIAMSEGMIDLRYHDTLKDAIAYARKTGKGKAEADAAEAYLRHVFDFCSGDIAYGVNPYNGTPTEWGDDRFPDVWREMMQRHITAILKQTGPLIDNVKAGEAR